MPISKSERKKKSSVFEMPDPPKIPPSVEIRKAKNGYVATKRGGDIKMEDFDYRGVEVVFEDAEKAVKECAEFLETGKSGSSS